MATNLSRMCQSEVFAVAEAAVGVSFRGLYYLIISYKFNYTYKLTNY